MLILAQMPQYPLCLGVDKDLREPLRRAHGEGTTRGAPRKTPHLDGTCLGARCCLRQATPGNFRIGIHDSRDTARITRGRLAGNDLGSHLALVHSLVGQHRLSGDITDSKDTWIGSTLLRI